VEWEEWPVENSDTGEGLFQTILLSCWPLDRYLWKSLTT